MKIGDDHLFRNGPGEIVVVQRLGFLVQEATVGELTGGKIGQHLWAAPRDTVPLYVDVELLLEHLLEPCLSG